MVMRILHVDEQPILRCGVASVLSKVWPNGHVLEAGTGREALLQASGAAPELVITELSLPDRSGLEVVTELARICPKAAIVVLTAQDPRLGALRAIAAGARAFLSKSQPVSELVHAARTTLAGGRYITPEVANLLADRFESGTTATALHDQLSQRELDVLRMLAGGRALKDVAGTLCISPKTVSTYRTRILEKLRLRSNAELVRYAMDTGLVD